MGQYISFPTSVSKTSFSIIRRRLLFCCPFSTDDCETLDYVYLPRKTGPKISQEDCSDQCRHFDPPMQLAVPRTKAQYRCTTKFPDDSWDGLKRVWKNKTETIRDFYSEKIVGDCHGVLTPPDPKVGTIPGSIVVDTDVAVERGRQYQFETVRPDGVHL